MNIALRIRDVSRIFPQKKSVVFSQRRPDGQYDYPSYTFCEFESRSNQMANKFAKLGIGPGTRTLLFVKPCLDFSVITFALFKVGAVPVLIDPGMGLASLLRSVEQVKPRALVSIGKVHWMRRVLRRAFRSVEINISLEQVYGNTHHLYQNLAGESEEFEPVEREETDLSAILFTSGGTGSPKGVLYTHGILNAQTDALKSMFALSPGDTDLPGFPLFALFTLAMGMTSVIPDMDPTKPAACDPQKIVTNIQDSKATFVAGSPIIWERVGKYCLEQKIQLGSVKQVVMFGAPVRSEIHQMYQQILPHGDTYTPYGATECLPVSLISGSEVLAGKQLLSLQGKGTCVGKAVPGVEIKILDVSDSPKTSLDEVAPDMVGEIAVSGRQVTRGYFELEEETVKSKIAVDDILWHRMGDLGWLDGENNLWFLGRKAHRVETREGRFYPLEVEAVFNQHPEVRRSALVGIELAGEKQLGVVIERRDQSSHMEKKFLNELRELAMRTEATQKVSAIFLHSNFPVDVRHNIKIDRLKLSSWAKEHHKSSFPIVP
ncbi:MAG TPA: fatty acid CoA ligase family protein [Bacteriovoracaceae bacterium]|nr:fatty acid CoA ligase family protein [Bacteriovoracaceae bacterium]